MNMCLYENYLLNQWIALFEVYMFKLQICFCNSSILKSWLYDQRTRAIAIYDCGSS